MELSKRLWTVASAVTPDQRVADVGTDHGYIPIYLVKNGICPKAFAMDVNAGPLERAREHIETEMLSDKIETRLGNGLEKLTPEEVDTVIIAGMGGDLICRILTGATSFFVDRKEFILQPQSEWFKVRHLIHNYGYQIQREWFLKEDGKYYVVMKAVPGSKQEKYEKEIYYTYGYELIKEKNPVFLEYLQKEIEKKKQILTQMQQKQMSAGKKTEKELQNKINREQRCKELQEEIENIHKILE